MKPKRTFSPVFGILLCFFLLPLAGKLLLSIPSSILTLYGSADNASALLVCGQFLAVLSDILLPLFFAWGLTFIVRGYYDRIAGPWRLPLAAGLSLLLTDLLGVLLSYLLCLFDLAEQTPSVFRAELPYYLLIGLLPELLLGLLAVVLTAIIAALGQKKKSRQVKIRLITVIIWYAVLLLARLLNILLGLGDVSYIAEAYGVFSGEWMRSVLSTVLLPLLYFAVCAGCGIFLTIFGGERNQEK